jgi:hypothetical protein
MATNNGKRACSAKIRLLTARNSPIRQKICVLIRQSVRNILLA